MRTRSLLLLACLLVGIGSLQAQDRDGVPYHESLTPGRYRQWRLSDDGQISVCLTTDKTTFTAAEGITIRCVVRNNSQKKITLRRPFGDSYFAESTGLNLLGPDGPVRYVGPHKEYILGSEAFLELGSKSVIEESFAIPKDRLPGIDKPGLYVIDYRYGSAGHPAQPPPENYWTGSVDTHPVTVLVK